MGRRPNTSGRPERSGSVEGMEDNMKKAVSEMLVLHLLSEQEMYIGEIPKELEKRSGGKFHIVFPYSVIYRMQEYGYIEELPKRVAPDGRRRQYYRATRSGKAYLKKLRTAFRQMVESMEVILGERTVQENEEITNEGIGGSTVYEANQEVSDMQRVEETSADAETGSNARHVFGGLAGSFA